MCSKQLSSLMFFFLYDRKCILRRFGCIYDFLVPPSPRSLVRRPSPPSSCSHLGLISVSVRPCTSFGGGEEGGFALHSHFVVHLSDRKSASRTLCLGCPKCETPSFARSPTRPS